MKIFEINNIHKSFNGIHAVNDFSFSWPNSNIVGLIGPNGAGKTTLFNIITGFMEADKGTFYFKGRDILKLPAFEIVNFGLSRTFQDLRLLRQITVLENILIYCLKQVGELPFAAFFRNKKYIENRRENIEKANNILNTIGLLGKKDELAGTLSFGQQKLLTLGCCLATDAECLLLDEPVSGVNQKMIEKILILLKSISEQNRKILLIEHNIEAVRNICDWIIVMDEGYNIAEGYPSEVLKREKIIEAYMD